MESNNNNNNEEEKNKKFEELEELKHERQKIIEEQYKNGELKYNKNSKHNYNNKNNHNINYNNRKKGGGTGLRSNGGGTKVIF